MYRVAIRPLQVNGETRWPGDPIPEAATWGQNLKAYLETGMVVDDGIEEPSPGADDSPVVRPVQLQPTRSRRRD